MKVDRLVDRTPEEAARRLAAVIEIVRDSFRAAAPALCQLCQRPAAGGWCPPRVRPDCYAEARRRLGVPEHQVRRLRAHEWRAAIEARDR